MLREADERQKREAIAAGRKNLHEYWREDNTCSYCGSMTAAEAIKRLKTPGTDFSGADWKYGWPHKFYIGSGPSKFYNEHLADASDAEFAEFAEIANRFFDVEFTRVDGKVKWSAYGNTQRYGLVAADGSPEHRDRRV